MPGFRKNILFTMFDQLRWDYLSCAGHKSLKTPNIDRIAEKGVRFTNNYVQSPVCGPSRMSFYTGRYASSHGAQWNNYPLRVGEMTLGDHLRALGMDCWLIGKTHMQVDAEGMARLGIAREGVIGARVAECGFDVVCRDDGLWAEGPDGAYDASFSPYNAYLKSKGYEAENPWLDFANAGIDEDGDLASGWFMKNACRPANVREEDSETTWLTTEAINFIEKADPSRPWCAHVSYIKPHWPYIVPAPYHNMYGVEDIQPVVRGEAERQNPHPVFGAFQNNFIGKAFHRDEVRKKVIPAYMGLIKQIDDQMGRLFGYLETTGRMQNTVIVLTSDHGDYLGDHWMGEKDLFHGCSVKVPLIVYDPGSECDPARGTVSNALTEGIDLAATFIEMAGGEVPAHIVEGRSLCPFLRGEKPENWRQFAVSEYDYAVTPQAAQLGVKSRDARLFMIATERWKFMHSEGPGHPPMLFDMRSDPDELFDLGQDPACAHIIDDMYEHLGKWGIRMSQRTTRSEADLAKMRGKNRRRGILLGIYDDTDVDVELTSRVAARKVPNYRQ